MKKGPAAHPGSLLKNFLGGVKKKIIKEENRSACKLRLAVWLLLVSALFWLPVAYTVIIQPLSKFDYGINHSKCMI
jgi:hypothetical protein